MKKIIFVVFLIIMLASLFGCGNNEHGGAKIEAIDVTGLSVAEARSQLESAGFKDIEAAVDPGENEDQWIVTDQNILAGQKEYPDFKIVLSCSEKYQLYLDIKSIANLFFSKYDITIYVDNKEIGTVEHGDRFTNLVDVASGTHTIVFCKAGGTSPKHAEEIQIDHDTTFSCKLQTESNSIVVKDVITEDNADGARLEIPDVTHKVLSDAKSILSEAGFINVKATASKSIWEDGNWLVTSQSLSAGTVTDKNDEILLECISLDDYFAETYVNINLKEVQALAEEDGFSLEYRGDSSSKLEHSAETMNESEKEDWIASEAWQYSGKDKTVAVTFEYRGVSESVDEQETLSDTQSVETKEESEDANTDDDIVEYPREDTTSQRSQPVNYSTNDQETAKLGNSGVFSYRDRGGQYYNYIIIDFDEGYIYSFREGNGDTTCDKVKIDYGDLNNGLCYTYHDGDYIWTYWLHFNWVNQPDHLILVDDDGFDYDYYTTNLDSALSIRDTKTIYNY